MRLSELSSWGWCQSVVLVCLASNDIATPHRLLFCNSIAGDEVANSGFSYTGLGYIGLSVQTTTYP